MLTKYSVFWHLIWYIWREWNENVEYCEEAVQFGFEMRVNLEMCVYLSCNPIAIELQLK